MIAHHVQQGEAMVRPWETGAPLAKAAEGSP